MGLLAVHLVGDVLSHRLAALGNVRAVLSHDGGVYGLGDSSSALCSLVELQVVEHGLEVEHLLALLVHVAAV